MRTTRHKRTATVRAVPSAPSAQSSLEPMHQLPALRNSMIAAREFGGRSKSAVEHPSAEVRLSSDGTFLAINTNGADELVARHRQLAIAIRQRIESRLVGRVRNLSVRISDNTIVLEGQCFTYYTKQLAQHAALGVLNHEQLENDIVVSVP